MSVRLPNGESLQILAHVDLSVGQGERVAIIGRSGAGKTTLLSIIGLLSKPTTGRVSIAGQPTEGLNDHCLSQIRASNIGFVFQDSLLLPRRSVAENVALGLKYAGMVPDEGKVAGSLAMLGIAHKTGTMAMRLSGGEQQRAAIARAMVKRPALILCDEPTGNLDSFSSGQVLDALGTVCSEAGSAVVVVTHDKAVKEWADRTVEIDDGILLPD